MLTDALVLLALGTLALLLPLSRAYRSHLSRRITSGAGVEVPHEQAAALEARMTRRARAVGVGILLAGVVLAGAALVWPAGTEEPTGGYVVFSLMFVFGAAALAVVEIARPGDVEGARTARATAPTVADYVALETRALSWTFAAIGFGVLLLALGLGRTPWFSAGPLWRSPVPVLAVALPVLVLLSELAIRRVLDAPQPARDEAELYWQDAVRANTLTSLTVPPALVGLLALIVTGAVLDDAASAAAVGSGEVGPDWSLWLLIGGYMLPFALIVGAVAVAARRGGSTDERFRERLWGGRPAGGPAAQTGA